MTFVQLQDAVMDRLNLTSTEARTRIKVHLNLRYRRVQTTINAARTRRAVHTWTTSSGNPVVSGSGIAKVFNLFGSGSSAALLPEVSFEQLRLLDPAGTSLGDTKVWTVQDHRDDVVRLRLHPTPSSTETLYSDILAAGTELVADASTPQIPADFHDVLIHGAMADELLRMEKARPLAMAQEAVFEQRLGELRYFMAKSAYLATHQADAVTTGANRRQWPNNTL